MENLQCDENVQTTAGRKRMVDGNQVREEKRRKWEAKQARKREGEERELSRRSWFQENSHFASLVREPDVDFIQKVPEPTNTEVSPLMSLLEPYFDVQDKPIKEIVRKDSSKEHLFVAEGTETIRILIQQSQKPRVDGLQCIQLRSIFVKPSLLFEQPVNLMADVMEARKLNKVAKGESPGFHVLVGSEGALSKVAGFPVSRGALACGVIPTDRNEAWLSNLLKSRLSTNGSKKIRLLALDGICDTSNLGSMIRCASAFGIDAIVVSHDTCECWYRRSIRVSMGHIFNVPVVRVQDLSSEIKSWSDCYPELVSFAAVIDTDTLLEDIRPQTVSTAWCCVMGNEGNGISENVSKACTTRIRISIAKGVDSLSVPIACGILLHGLKEREASNGGS